MSWELAISGIRKLRSSQIDQAQEIPNCSINMNEQAQYRLMLSMRQTPYCVRFPPMQVPEPLTANDHVLFKIMMANIKGRPYALFLSDKTTGNKVYATVYDDAFKLVMHVLHYSSATVNHHQAIAAYYHWLRNSGGLTPPWSPQMFLDKWLEASFKCYNWQVSENFHKVIPNSNENTPAVSAFTSINLAHPLQVHLGTITGACMEIVVEQKHLDQFLLLNTIPNHYTYEDIIPEIRKARFLLLGEPLTSLSQYMAALIKSLSRSGGHIPSKMVTWVRDIDILSRSMTISGQQVPAYLLEAVESLRGTGVLPGNYPVPHSLLNAQLDAGLAEYHQLAGVPQPPNYPTTQEQINALDTEMHDLDADVPQPAPSRPA